MNEIWIEWIKEVQCLKDKRKRERETNKKTKQNERTTHQLLNYFPLQR